MKQSHLNKLLIISIEQETAHNINFNAIEIFKILKPYDKRTVVWKSYNFCDIY